MASDSEISCTNDPNFAVIYSFLKVFGKLYGLDVPSIAKFQEFIENTQEVLDPIKEIHLRLLRRALKSVQSNKWERSLIKFCHQHGHHQEAWEMERFSYKKASAQVKLKVLKLLLEYQFTCHPKFKSAVNALSCKDLRLDPIGRDKNGCVYWYHVDDDANLCLYKEDQDEETWQMVARNREELLKVISQLKNGEEVCPLVSANTNEDSSSADIPPQTETNPEGDEENEEEFLSPESESEHEVEKQNEKSKSPEREEQKEITDPNHINKEENSEHKEFKEEKSENSKPDETPLLENNIDKENTKQETTANDNNKKEENESLCETIEEPVMIVTGEGNGADCESYFNTEDTYFYENNTKYLDSFEQKNCVSEPFSEVIEEPLMFITGEGNGVDCDSPYIIGEEITEEIMYFYGEGSGYDNDTGNPETIEQDHSAEENTDAENREKSEECINGEHDVPDMTNSAKVVKSVKMKSGVTSVNKRTLKKQNNDTTEVLKSEPKKPCVRIVNLPDCPNSTKSAESATDSRESSVTDKSTTDNETTRKNNVQKGKVKKKCELGNKLKLNAGKEILNSVTESDNCHDSKSSIIEKRKSSVSSVEQEEHDHAENEKEKSPDKEVKVGDPLPPKKLRLDTPENDVPESISNETLDSKNRSLNEKKVDSKLKVKVEDVENSVLQRKKIKANKGKFKRKRILKIKTENDAEKDDSDNNTSDKEKKANKSLKRTLLDATLSDKNKSESQSESEEDEPVTSGKRLKIKPKKIITSSRKKVEAKLRQKHSSDESEEETLYSIAGKKSPKKVLKRKPKGKEKGKAKKKEAGGESGAKSEDSDAAPVRQSRRIAQMKIREEAERRLLEEVALREMKMIHKKKNKDDEEEWQASGSSSGGDKVRSVRKGGDKWRGGDSTGPDQDSESDEPLFEIHDEPDLIDNTKSDHEFSPESDLESGEPVEPLKRVRTLQEGKEDGVCARCGSGEQPEWILLCDQCDAGYHASCLKPMLFLVPEGDWYCPPCNHDMLIASLEKELVKYDELVVQVEAERARRKQEEPENQSDDDKKEKADSEENSHSEGESSSGWSSSSSSGAVYRLRARKQLPVSYRSQEYDRLISSAIKEEYVEPTTSAGNQGRGKDISTIIEAAEEEKMKAEREALEQGKPVELKKLRKKTRRKPRKLNSLEVPSEDDDETDEDFKETGIESSSEEISSSAERDCSSDSQSSDDLPIRRTGRTDKKGRPKLAESSPEVKKKKKGVFEDSSSESAGAKEWSKTEGKKSKSKSRPKNYKPSKKSRKRSGLTQYDAAGNVVRARVTYGGLSDDGPNDWSPKHRTRQKKINYTEMPNTESEDEMHKSSGKHMADSSDEFKVEDSELSSDSDAERAAPADERQRALNDLVCKTAVVPLEKLPEDITKAKTEQLEEHLKAQQEALEAEAAEAARGRGRGRGRGARGAGRGGRSRPAHTDDALAKLVGVKIKDLKTDGTPVKPNDIERAKKRQEREAKQAEKEARRVERLQKKEEKEKLKEQKAKEREEKKLARIALQESKRMKKEKVEFPMAGGFGPRPGAPPAPPGPRLTFPHDFTDQRFPTQPRLQVRAELRGVAGPEERLHAVAGLREGTLSVAGSPQPFKPVTEEPSIITRMPHMINQQYRGPMMYPPGNSPYGPRGQNMMYPLHHPGMNPGQRHQYPPGYYPPQMRGLPPAYPPTSSPGPHAPHLPPGHPAHRALGPPGHLPAGSHSPAGSHPPAGHLPAGSHPPAGHLPAGSQPPAGHLPAGSHPPAGHLPAGSHPPAGHLPAGSHPPAGHLPAGSHPPAGHMLAGSHLPAGSHPPAGHLPAGSHSPAGHLHAGSHPSAGPHPPPGHIPAGPHAQLGHPGGPHPSSAHHGPNSHGMPGQPLHGQLRPMMGPPGPHGPHGLHRPHPHGSPGPSSHGATSHPHASPVSHASNSPSPLAAAARPAPTPPATPPSTAPAPTASEPPVKIKAEVKTEPEYRTPPTSPRPPSPRDEPPRHPKIKHTENKDRRPRYPLGPYAPQYGPYGPYAPTPGGPSDGHSPLIMSRPPAPGPHPLQRMQQLHRLLPAGAGNADERARSPRPDMSYLAAHIRSTRPPFFPPPMQPRAPDCSSPAGPPHYSSAYADLQHSALSKQLAAPPSMPMPPQQRERLERLSSPPSRSAPTPPGPAAPGPEGPPASPADPVREEHIRRPPSAPRDVAAPPYLKPSDATASAYLKSSAVIAPPYLNPNDAVASPYLKSGDAAVPPYLKLSEAAPPPYLKPSEGVAQTYMKQTDVAAPPYMKPSEAGGPHYLKPSEAGAPPYLKPSEAGGLPYLKPSETGVPPYLKPSEAGGPPYLKPSEAGGPPYLKPSEAGGSPYLKPSEAGGPPYLKPSEAGGPPYLKPSEAGGPPYLKPSEAGGPPYLKPSEAGGPPYLKPSEAGGPPYLKPSEAGGPPYLKPSEAGGPPYLKPSEAAPPSVKAEREEGSVFGGLVSYFSSQREDDVDA